MRAESQNITRRMRPLLGTFVEVACAGEQGAEGRAATWPDAAFECAFDAIEAVERCLSFQNPASELSELNRSGGRAVALSALSIRVLRAGRALSLASGGLFNYTIGGTLVRRGQLPRQHDCDVLDCGDVSDVEIEGSRVRLRRPVLVTLDGIAKGFAVDRAVRALRTYGVRSGWINAGGDLRAFGTVTVPVARRECDGSIRALGGLRASSIATSVVHEAPDTRFPGEIHGPGGMRAEKGAWTVLAHTAWKADALTKVAALAPPAQRSALVRRLGGVLVQPGASH